MSLLFGWILDLLFGDPARLPHPVVYIGRWIAFWEKRLNLGNYHMLKGAILVIVTILLVFAGTAAVLYLLSLTPYTFHILHFTFNIFHLTLSSILIFFCLAGHTLRREVRMTFEAVDRSVEEGRTQVARIVGRDTQSLSAQEIRQAALETLAENLSDGVIAPLFWLALLGVPGMLTYKVINTFDSMIGYRTDRYRQFGCWAAHIDDIANYIPARLTALLILIVGNFSRRQNRRAHYRFLLRFGPAHASPNSGWPEAALAAILDCRFGGTHDYFGQAVEKPYIGTNPRPLTTADCRLSIRIALIAETIAVILTISLIGLISHIDPIVSTLF
ncbi:MAG: cobalamin biosynthesis protein CobD [Bacteroidaceae bacterium]|nr:cobalamin biosynthesis protein CobD [Bacteroidaceae bacterium]